MRTLNNTEIASVNGGFLCLFGLFFFKPAFSFSLALQSLLYALHSLWYALNQLLSQLHAPQHLVLLAAVANKGGSYRKLRACLNSGIIFRL